MPFPAGLGMLLYVIGAQALRVNISTKICFNGQSFRPAPRCVPIWKRPNVIVHEITVVQWNAGTESGELQHGTRNTVAFADTTVWVLCELLRT